jgi:hypothetical protein
MTATDPVLSQLSYSVVAIWVIQKLKECKWLPWINQNSDTVNKVVAVVVSFIAAIGVQWTVQGGLQDGGTITITYPSLATMLALAVKWLQSYAVQQGMYTIYKGAKK